MGRFANGIRVAMGAESSSLLDTRDVAEAQTIMEGLPLAKEEIVDHEYIAVGPLLPLRLLMANPERQQ